MSFQHNPLVSRQLICKITALQTSRHDTVVAALHGCSLQLFRCIFSALSDTGYARTDVSAEEYVFEEGLEAHQRTDKTEWIRKTDTQCVPCFVVVGRKRKHVVHSIPAGSVCLTQETVLSSDDVSLLPCMPFLATRFRHTTTFDTGLGYTYTLTKSTPLGSSDAMDASLEKPEDQQVLEVAVCGRASTAKGSMDFIIANTLHLLQGLYNPELSVRIE